MTNNIEQAREYILTAPLAISGRGGHNTTFKVACTLIHGFELSDADALKLMTEYNERLDEPWTPVELRHKVDGASIAASRRPPGYMLSRHEPYKRTPVAPPAHRTTWKITSKTATPAPPLAAVTNDSIDNFHENQAAETARTKGGEAIATVASREKVLQ